MPLQVSGVYVQIREAHTRDGWDIGGPLVAARQHTDLQERQHACHQRPHAVGWMRGVCDAMHNGFSDAYGAWPTAFFVFELLPKRGEHEKGSQWVLVYRSRPTNDAHIEVTHVLQQLWSTGV